MKDQTTKTLADGTRRTYVYEVDEATGERRTIAQFDSTDSGSLPCYRASEKQRIVASLLADSSLLVVGEAGAGKSALGEYVVAELQQAGFVAMLVAPAATKQCLTGLAQALGVELVDLEGKPLTVAGLETAIGESLKTQQVFLIWDNAHRLQVSLRGWLERLHEQGQPMLLLATHPPARDIFLRLPRIELKPLKSAAMRALMQQRAEELGMSLHDGQIAALLERCGGNPMLARRVVWEEFLGLEDLAPDHTQWVDGTPFLVAFLMCFMVVRFIGRGLGSTSLYLLGAMLTVAVGVVRLLLLSLPRRKGRLGQ